MRKTPEDFYNLYTTKFRPLRFKEANGGEDSDDFEKDKAAWFDFMLCVVRTYGEFIDWNCDYRRLPLDLCGYPTLASILNACSDETTRRLLAKTQSNFERGLVEFLSFALSSVNIYFCRLYRIWLRELISLRYDLEVSEFVDFCNFLKEKNNEKVSD